MNTAVEITDYAAALEFLLGRINYERTSAIPYTSRSFKLERMHQLLAALGDPHASLPAVHLAGTKGKGSTAAMLSAILVAGGYRTGLYTSPHLERIDERFVINGQACNEQQLVALAATVQPAVFELDQICAREGELGPTFFEITTAMGMLYFAQQHVDVAILEVGLGGRLDSTNVCRPLATAITSISYDHTAQLGKTLDAIAREKAGIIKPRVPVVSGVTEEPAGQTIAEVARNNGAALILKGRDFDCQYNAGQDSTGSFESSNPSVDVWVNTANGRQTWPQLKLPLLGRHQAANAAVALALLNELRPHSFEVANDAVRQGLSAARCSARIEVLCRRPTVIVDAAHNVASAAALAVVLDESFRVDGERTLLFATSADKDARGMLNELLPQFQRVVFTRFQSNPRGADPTQLRKLASEIVGERVITLDVAERPADAVSQLRDQVSNNDLVCAAGSFFLAAEIRQLFQATWSATNRQVP